MATASREHAALPTKLVWAALLVALLCGEARGLQTYSCRFLNERYDVFPEGQPRLCSGTIPSSLDNPTTLCAGYVHYIPTFVDVASSTDAFAAGGFNASLFDQLWSFNDVLYRAHLADAHPNVQFLQLNGIECTRALHISGYSFTCSQDGNEKLRFGPVFTDIEDNDYSVAVTVVDDSIDLTLPLTIAFARLQASRDLHVARRDALASNLDRVDRAEDALGFLYFFIALGLCGYVVLSSMLQAWAMPIRRLNPRNPVPPSTLLWIAVWVVLAFVLLMAVGLPGLTVVFFTMVFKDCCTMVGYLLCCRVDPKSRPPRLRELIDLKVPPEERVRVRDEFKGDKAYRYRPYRFSRRQVIHLLVTLAVLVGLLLVVITVLYGWDEREYRVWDRARATAVVETMPSMYVKRLMSLYIYKGFATFLQFDLFNQIASEMCENMYNKELSSDAERKQKIHDEFVAAFDADMTPFARRSYLDYRTVNDWFTRELAAGWERRIQRNSPVDNILASPVYGRAMAFDTVPSDQLVWVKDEDFTITELMGSEAQANVFEGGTVIVLRMNPADYHRFHSPFDGYVSYMGHEIGSKLMSVNMDAVQSENNVLYNKRRTLVIATQRFGKIAMVVVGSTCVGSLEFDVASGQAVQKGEELGHFAFGGSTVVLVFQPDALEIDPDLLQNSERRFETRVELGMRLGLFQ